MAYSPYYTGGWADNEEGLTPMTADALNHMEDGITNNSQRLDTNVRLTLYRSVTDLGLTAGSATIAAVYAALPLYSILETTITDFATNEVPVPYPYGIVRVVKNSAASRGYAYFFGKYYGDYRMNLTAENAFTGTWVSASGIDTVQYSAAVAVEAGGRLDGTINLSRTGYMPLGVIGWNVSGNGSTFCAVYRLYISGASSGSGTLNYSLRSTSSSTALDGTIYVRVLWMRV